MIKLPNQFSVDVFYKNQVNVHQGHKDRYVPTIHHINFHAVCVFT